MKKERNGRLTPDQTAYAEDILETFGMIDAKTISSPLDPGRKHQKGNDDSSAREDLPRKYRQAIRALLYLVRGTRPDLAFALPI